MRAAWSHNEKKIGKMILTKVRQSLIVFTVFVIVLHVTVRLHYLPASSTAHFY
jgi:hypothetical protein